MPFSLSSTLAVSRHRLLIALKTVLIFYELSWRIKPGSVTEAITCPHRIARPALVWQQSG